MLGRGSFGVGLEKLFTQRKSAMKETFSLFLGMTNADRLFCCKTGWWEGELGSSRLSRRRARMSVAVTVRGGRCRSAGGVVKVICC